MTRTTTLIATGLATLALSACGTAATTPSNGFVHGVEHALNSADTAVVRATGAKPYDGFFHSIEHALSNNGIAGAVHS